MPKSALLIKTIDILRLNPGITVTELASQLDRSERTVYRWLSELSSDLGAAIYCNDGGYYLAARNDARSVDLNPQELLALRLSLKSSPFTESSPIGKHAESAWLKIRQAVPSDELVQARDLASFHAVKVNHPVVDINANVVETLENALNKHRRLHVVYRSQRSGMVKEYVIDPYAMVFRRHGWYVLAFSHKHNEVVQFKLVRFERATETGETFDIPEDFDVDEFFRLSWEAWASGDATVVKVRFLPRVAPMIMESKRHPTQVVYPQPDGSVIFEVCVSGIEEIAIWIMGYGSDAEVLEPESLRGYILENAKCMVDIYDNAKKKLSYSLTH